VLAADVAELEQAVEHVVAECIANELDAEEIKVAYIHATNYNSRK
jgi:hypothetical protein